MSSTPLRRVRSITKKDKINQQASLADPQKLFDLCVELILESYQLAGKAVIHLPHGHAQYLLCLALKRQREGRLSDSSILHKLITSWPYAELSFNFRLNPLVIKNLGSLQPVGHPWTFGCVEPHVYYNICGLSKSRYSSCAREISIGLFNHVYRLNQDGSTPRMKIVDLSDFEQFSSDSGTSYLDTGTTIFPAWHGNLWLIHDTAPVAAIFIIYFHSDRLIVITNPFCYCRALNIAKSFYTQEFVST
jgi:hypothetical protein